jgi:hypothetical protein
MRQSLYMRFAEKCAEALDGEAPMQHLTEPTSIHRSTWRSFGADYPGPSHAALVRSGASV